MKIKRLSWRNYKGLQDGNIIADGRDVLISGRNGSGKSSIAEMIPFVLFGTVTGSLKRYDAHGLTMRDRLIHGAEVEFDDGLILRRELLDSSSGGNTAKLYINGAPVPKRQFDAKVESLTNGAGELILNPFAFFTMTAKERRNFIARLFGTISEREFLSTSENKQLATLFGKLTAEGFIAKCKTDLKTKQIESHEIPARLEELTRQRASIHDTSTLDELDNRLTAKRSEQRELLKPIPQPQTPAYRIGDLERQEIFLTRQLERERTRRENLLTEYRRLKAQRAGTCPTCGQPIPAEVFEAKRDEQLLSVVSEGKLIAAQIKEFESELTNVRKELATNREIAEQSAEQSAKYSAAEAQRLERLAALQSDINALESEKLNVKTALALDKRIDELKARERSLNEQIATLEGNLARAEKFQHEKILRFEEEINGNFEHARFKLFDRLIDGTPREVCEAMLDGVPYVSLSKGEKLKAALDIFRAIQRRYEVELPLIIDDAESYTANSLVDVPNQKIILRVTESDLTIEIEEGRLAA